ncbi:hypothetical protein DFH28DRAFT_228688 [Melampsora americana]|nr:hypothetical protein DFH28DRAFT_228688 [Melampsora americana]
MKDDSKDQNQSNHQNQIDHSNIIISNQSIHQPSIPSQPILPPPQQQQQLIQQQQQQFIQQQRQQQHYQQQQQQQHQQQHQRPINSTELPRIPGFDLSAIQEISQIIRQSNGNPNAFRLSPAQINLWNQYRSKCESSTFNSSTSSQPKEPIHPSQAPQPTTFHQQQQYNQRIPNPQISNLNRSSFNLGSHPPPHHNGINPNGQPNQTYENRSSNFHPTGAQLHHDHRSTLNPNLNLINPNPNPNPINEPRSGPSIFNLPARSASPFTPPPPSIQNGHHLHSPPHHPHHTEITTANGPLMIFLHLLKRPLIHPINHHYPHHHHLTNCQNL